MSGDAKTSSPAAGEPAPARRRAAPSGGSSGAVHMLLGIVLLIVVAINAVNATSRYLFGIAPLGADELMIYLIIFMVMIGSVVSLLTRTHISINLLPLYTPARARRLWYILHDVAAILAGAFATHASWLFIAKISRIGVTSMGLGISMTLPHSALLLGFAGLTLAGGILLVRDVFSLLRNAPLSGRKP